MTICSDTFIIKENIQLKSLSGRCFIKKIIFTTSFGFVFLLLGNGNDGLLSIFHPDPSAYDAQIKSRFARVQPPNIPPFLCLVTFPSEVSAQIGKKLSQDEHITLLDILGPHDTLQHLKTRFDTRGPSLKLLSMIVKAQRRTDISQDTKGNIKDAYKYFYPLNNIEDEIEAYEAFETNLIQIMKAIQSQAREYEDWESGGEDNF